MLLPKDAPWLEEFSAELLRFPAAMTIRSMRCRKVSLGTGRHGSRRWFSEGQLDWEANLYPGATIPGPDL